MAQLSCSPCQSIRVEDINFPLDLYEALEPLLRQMPQVRAVLWACWGVLRENFCAAFSASARLAR